MSGEHLSAPHLFTSIIPTFPFQLLLLKFSHNISLAKETPPPPPPRQKKEERKKERNSIADCSHSEEETKDGAVGLGRRKKKERKKCVCVCVCVCVCMGWGGGGRGLSLGSFRQNATYWRQRVCPSFIFFTYWRQKAENIQNLPHPLLFSQSHLVA